jgi:hypothetical protein
MLKDSNEGVMAWRFPIGYFGGRPMICQLGGTLSAQRSAPDHECIDL